MTEEDVKEAQVVNEQIEASKSEVAIQEKENESYQQGNFRNLREEKERLARDNAAKDQIIA